MDAVGSLDIWFGFYWSLYFGFFVFFFHLNHHSFLGGGGIRRGEEVTDVTSGNTTNNNRRNRGSLKKCFVVDYLEKRIRWSSIHKRPIVTVPFPFSYLTKAAI